MLDSNTNFDTASLKYFTLMACVYFYSRTADEDRLTIWIQTKTVLPPKWRIKEASREMWVARQWVFAGGINAEA